MYRSEYVTNVCIYSVYFCRSPAFPVDDSKIAQAKHIVDTPMHPYKMANQIKDVTPGTIVSFKGTIKTVSKTYNLVYEKL